MTNILQSFRHILLNSHGLILFHNSKHPAKLTFPTGET